MTKPTFVAAHGAMPEGRKKILPGIAELCLASVEASGGIRRARDSAMMLGLSGLGGLGMVQG